MHRYNLREGTELGLGLTRITDSAREQNGGPTPKLISRQDMRMVHQTELDFIDFDFRSPPIVAIPLITCAAVVIASTDPDAPLRGALYHALSGDLDLATIARMHAGIGGPPVASLLALYVVTNEWDNHYNNDAMNLE